MYQIDFNKPLHIHFIGIGGISMSGLAEILLKEGFPISGSDSRKSELTAIWRALAPLSALASALPISQMTLNWLSIQPPSTRTIRSLHVPAKKGSLCSQERSFWDRL